MEAVLSLSVAKGYSLVGFTPVANVPRHYFLKDTNVVVPWPEKRGPSDKVGKAPDLARKYQVRRVPGACDWSVVRIYPRV
eukprot:334286-Prorocentrum_minimum.AAC.1